MKVHDASAVLLVSRSLPPAPAEYDRFLNATENVGTWGEWGLCPPILVVQVSTKHTDILVHLICIENGFI